MIWTHLKHSGLRYLIVCFGSRATEQQFYVRGLAESEVPKRAYSGLDFVPLFLLLQPYYWRTFYSHVDRGLVIFVEPVYGGDFDSVLGMGDCHANFELLRDDLD